MDGVDKAPGIYRLLVALPLGIAAGFVALAQTVQFSCGSRVDCIPIFELMLGLFVAFLCVAWLSIRIAHLIPAIVGFIVWVVTMRLAGPPVCPDSAELCGRGFVLAIGTLAIAALIPVVVSKSKRLGDSRMGHFDQQSTADN